MLLSETKGQVPFYENISCVWMRNKEIPLYYHHRNLELQLKSVSAYLEACFIQKDRHGSLSLEQQT